MIKLYYKQELKKMNKFNKKLVFTFVKIGKKQRTKIHPIIINNKRKVKK